MYVSYLELIKARMQTLQANLGHDMGEMSS
jgi:hypothetical protein